MAYFDKHAHTHKGSVPCDSFSARVGIHHRLLNRQGLTLNKLKILSWFHLDIEKKLYKENLKEIFTNKTQNYYCYVFSKQMFDLKKRGFLKLHNNKLDGQKLKNAYYTLTNYAIDCGVAGIESINNKYILKDKPKGI